MVVGITGCHSASSRGPETISHRDRYLAANDWAELESARGEFIRDLRRRYGPPGNRSEHLDPFKGGEYGKRAQILLREWNPIRCKAEDVRTLLGPPRQETDSTLLYTFAHGMAGSGWKFGLDAAGTVSAVEFLPGE